MDKQVIYNFSSVQEISDVRDHLSLEGFLLNDSGTIADSRNSGAIAGEWGSDEPLTVYGETRLEKVVERYYQAHNCL